MSDLIPPRRVLISVSDKTNLIPFAKHLIGCGAQLISTGGTARALQEAGLDVTPVDEVTQFPEMMDGRLKTLHPRIHGGLLALRDKPEHVSAMKEHDIESIDMVCVNLYPFESTVAREGVTESEAIEQIDIGGPSMVRSAAKNHRFVAVVTDPAQYDQVIQDLNTNDGNTSFRLRRNLAAAAFARTAEYDTAIAGWMARRSREESDEEVFPQNMSLKFERAQQLRYGENPHQAGALYVEPGATEASVANAKQLYGKALSFCNLYDANGALELVKEVDPSKHAAAAVIKHANPCGFAVADDLGTAFANAYAGDPLAAFGGIVAMNREVDTATASAIVEGQKFLEVIVAPGFAADAQKMLEQRWKNVRLLATGPLPAPQQRDPADWDIKKITGGLLVQQRDLVDFDTSGWQHKAGPAPTPEMMHELVLAMIAVKHLKSNAVCLVRDAMLVGAGAGQMDRMSSCRIAIEKAGDRAKGAFVASDAFFPFRDGPDLLIKAGVKAIVQPGGSVRDEETITACEEASVTLVLTGRRHFRH